MKILLLSLGLVLSFSSLAQDIIYGEMSKKIELDEKPSFFFKVKNDGSMIAYTIPAPGRRAIEPGINKILNLETGQSVIMPGPHDPVFIGDSGLVIVPNLSHSQYELYAINDILASITQMKGISKALNGYYQSAGILKQEGERTYIRVIAEMYSRSHTMIDFVFDQKEGLLIDDSAGKVLCPNVNFKLPMLSKDGKYVGGLDMDTNTSGVWEIRDNVECKKVVDLGIKTGKLNFNSDNTKLTYHIYKKIGAGNSDTSENYVPHPEVTNVADIFVFDVKSGVHTQVTKNASSNSLYPDFTQDGRLVFTNHPHTTEKVSFVFLNLEAAAKN